MSGGLLTGTGAWGVDGNWSSLFKPVTDDKAIVPASMGNNITDAGGDAKAIDLDVLLTHAGYSAAFGASGAPIQTAADLVHVMGSGPFYFEAHKSGSNFITDEVRIECALASALVEIGSDAASLGDITRVHANRGNVTIKGGTQFSAAGLVVVSKIDGEGDVSLKLVSTADTLADFIQTAGKSFIDNIVTRMLIGGGECVKDVNKAVTIDVLPGGRLIYQHGASGGDVIMCRVHTDSVLDLTQNGLLKTLDTVIRYRGGKVEKNDSLHTITTFIDMDEEG